jgi:hypothetical protein
MKLRTVYNPERNLVTLLVINLFLSLWNIPYLLGELFLGTRFHWNMDGNMVAPYLYKFTGG